MTDDFGYVSERTIGLEATTHGAPVLLLHNLSTLEASQVLRDLRFSHAVCIWARSLGVDMPHALPSRPNSLEKTVRFHETYHSC
jgi:hypothetical protein